jgi:triphosphatase
MAAPAETASPRTDPRARELEWQLDAVDLRPVRRWLESRPEVGPALRPLGARQLRDRYLDTEDWRLYRAGYTLRIRTSARRAEATAKSRGTQDDGLRDRRELTEPLPADDPAALAAAGGPVGALVRALAGGRPLRELFAVRTRRQRYAIEAGGRVVAELALDDTSFPLPTGRPARLQRVEVEVEPSSEDETAPLVDELREATGLRPAGASKFEAGLLAAGLAPPGPPDLGPTDVDASMSIGEVAFAVLRTHFAEFLAHEPGARLGEDPEEVHDMRVAGRRLRAAISLFRDALPVRMQRLRDELKWVGGLLGEVRDLDVQLEQVRAWFADLSNEDRAALAPLPAALERRRGEARARLLHQLDSRRFERLTGGMSGLLRHGPLRRSRPSRTPALVAAPDLIRWRSRKFRKLGDRLGAHSSPEDLHALRIRGKRLRYAVEFLAPLYPKRSERLVKRLVAVQDHLGELQDAQVAMADLEELVAEADLPPRAVFLLGRMYERHARRAEELRRSSPPLYAAARGRPWKRLRRRMDRRRGEALAAAPPNPSTEAGPAAEPPDGPARPAPLAVVEG